MEARKYKEIIEFIALEVRIDLNGGEQFNNWLSAFLP